jgi:hypothetical protein
MTSCDSVIFRGSCSHFNKALAIFDLDKGPIENRRYSVSEFMEKPNLDIEISYCKNKLKEISIEYNSTMLSEWPTLRERELYFYRELYRLQKLKKDKEAAIELLENKNNMVILVEKENVTFMSQKILIKKSRVMKMNSGI